MKTERTQTRSALAAEIGQHAQRAVDAATSQPLDELAKRRLWSKINADIVSTAPVRGVAAKRRSVGFWVPSVVALAAAAIAVVMWSPWQSSSTSEVSVEELSDSPAVQQGHSTVVAAGKDYLVPVALVGPRSVAGTRQLGQKFDHVYNEYADKLVVRLPLGAGVLERDTRISIESVKADQSYALRLEGGTVRIAWFPDAGQAITIHAGHAEVTLDRGEIVIRSYDAGARVSVVRGTAVASYRNLAASRILRHHTWTNGRITPGVELKRGEIDLSFFAQASHSRLLDLSRLAPGEKIFADGKFIGVTPLVSYIGSETEVDISKPSSVVVGRVSPLRSPKARAQVLSNPPGSVPEHRHATSLKRTPNEDAERRYRTAERALARGALKTARAEWQGLIASHPKHHLADLARLDLAQLYEKQGLVTSALQLAEELVTSARDRQVRQSATRLRCRLASQLDRGVSCPKDSQ